MTPGEIKDKIFIIKKTGDDGQTFETIVSNKLIFMYGICLFASSREEPHRFLFILLVLINSASVQSFNFLDQTAC